MQTQCRIPHEGLAAARRKLQCLLRTQSCMYALSILPPVLKPGSLLQLPLSKIAAGMPAVRNPTLRSFQHEQSQHGRAGTVLHHTFQSPPASSSWRQRVNCCTGMPCNVADLLARTLAFPRYLLERAYRREVLCQRLPEVLLCLHAVVLHHHGTIMLHAWQSCCTAISPHRLGVTLLLKADK